MKVTDGYWWWRPTPQSKWKLVHVTDGGTKIRRIGYSEPIDLLGEFLQSIPVPAGGK